MKKNHQQKLQEAVEQLKKLKNTKPDSEFISLKPKRTSHFFRNRRKKHQLNLLAFDEILSISEEKLIAEVEGLVSFKKLTKRTLQHGLIPQVVPELRNITIGGTISGIGLESSSYKYGMVHNTVSEYEVLTGNGDVLKCSEKEHSDLFHNLPNSVGTLGYVTKATIKLKRALPFVHLKILHIKDESTFLKKLKSVCEQQGVDFVEGVIFSTTHFVLVIGEMIENVPNNSRINNFQIDIFWKFLKDNRHQEAFLPIQEYFWRWDTDAFWSLSGLGTTSKIIENPFFRKTVGRILLHSGISGIIKRWKDKLSTKSQSNSQTENVLQDLCINIESFSEFFSWYPKQIGIFPIWICPYKNLNKNRFPLLNFQGDFLLDIGIYTGKKRPLNTDRYYYNKLLEEKTVQLKGYKGHYSLSFFPEETFWHLYNKENYQQIKNKYDSDHAFPDIFQKCVGINTL